MIVNLNDSQFKWSKISGKFNKSTLSTIGVDFETKKLSLDDTDILLNIWDFAGEKKFRLLFPSYISGASGAVMMYDITDKESLEDLHGWIEIIEGVQNPPRTKILLEHKVDLEDQREVNIEEAEKIHFKYNFKGEIIGTSSKSGENVEKAFTNISRLLIATFLQTCRKCGEIFSKKLVKEDKKNGQI